MPQRIEAACSIACTLATVSTCAPARFKASRTASVPARRACRSSSAVKHASLVAVDIVEKRHVRKPRGAKPGEVQYQRERVVDVEPRQP